MKKKFITQTMSKANTRKGIFMALLLGSVTLSVFLLSNTTGPAKQGNLVTGAPFNNNLTCGKSGCHSGGSFGGTIITQLLDASNNVVTSYIPGGSYSFKITMNYTIGTPKGYGFQTAVSSSLGSLNINTWGTLITDYHNQTASGRNYVEQSKRLTSNIITLPWTGPAAGTGPVIFYSAGNLVNGNSSASGDEPVNNSLTIAEAGLLPVKLLYFKGSLDNGLATLSWATAQENNNRNFILEKSLNGTDYTAITTIAGKGSSSAGSQYTYADAGFFMKAFYRLKQTDADGNVSVYNIVELKNSVATDYRISIYAHGGSSYILFYNGLQQQKINIRASDLLGKILYSYNSSANKGDNIIQLPSTISRGILIVTVTTEDGRRTSAKVSIMR